MSWPEALSCSLRLSSRSSRSALDAVVSRAALGPDTEAPAVPSRSARDMLRPVGSATALSRSNTSSLRIQRRPHSNTLTTPFAQTSESEMCANGRDLRAGASAHRCRGACKAAELQMKRLARCGNCRSASIQRREQRGGPRIYMKMLPQKSDGALCPT